MYSLFKVFSFVGLFTLLAGCGDEAASDPEESESTGSGNVQLTYAHWDQKQQPGMQAIAAAFNEQHDNINVTVEVTPWAQYWTSLEAAAAGGSLPDVFWMHTQSFMSYAENELLLDLTDLAESSDLVDLNLYPDDLVEMFHYEEELYGFSKDFDSIGLWYNREIFDEAGLEYPDETWTWNDLLDNALLLNNPDEGIYGFLAPNNRNGGYHNFIYQNGGYVINEDKTESGWDLVETQEAVQQWVDFSLVHEVSPTIEQFAENDPLTYFQSGRAAMSFFGSWFASDLASNEYTAEHVDVTVLPEGPGGRATIYNGLANSVAASTDHPEEALLFVEFLASEEAMEIQAEHGSAIPSLEGMADRWVEAFPEFNTQVLVDQVEFGVVRPYSRESIAWERVEENAVIEIMNGDATVEEVAPDVYEGVTRILESEQE